MSKVTKLLEHTIPPLALEKCKVWVDPSTGGLDIYGGFRLGFSLEETIKLMNYLNENYGE